MMHNYEERLRKRDEHRANLIGTKIKVKVSRKHIRKGCHGNPRQCAIALALKESGLLKGPYVNDKEIWECYTSPFVKFPLPKKAVTWVKRFDQAKGINPIEFEIVGEEK
jgi:hypothetical protein